jgi:RNA polymerase sigma-70 factor (ECF subfamily)
MNSSEPAPLPPEPSAQLIATLEEGRRQFLALVADIRPALHRYCARMTGSLADGEDVVQDALARAYYQVAELKTLPPLRPWLFRIAHNLAIDHLRRAAYRASAPLDEAIAIADDDAREPDQALARSQAVGLAIVSFLNLAPAQRACVILKDVLDHSLDEIADLLELSVPAVKAALHRGRAALRALAEAAPAMPPPAAPPSPTLARYAALFNAHDWDAVRAMLADDVRLDLVSRRKAAGRRDVAVYFTNYEKTVGWHLALARLDGREVIAVTTESDSTAPPRYFIALEVGDDGRIATIRDYRYVAYILQDAASELVAGSG